MNKIAEMALLEASQIAQIRSKFFKLDKALDAYSDEGGPDSVQKWQDVLSDTGLVAVGIKADGSNAMPGDLILGPEDWPQDLCFWTPDGKELIELPFGTVDTHRSIGTLQDFLKGWRDDDAIAIR